MLSNMIRRVVRYEGKKFLDLREINDDFYSLHDQNNVKDKASLYVHIPFCRRLCPFCSFNRYPFKEDLAKHYYQNLRKEIEIYKNRGFTFDNVYFGGGTPTVSMEDLLEFLDFLHDVFDIKLISLETNPDDVNPDNLKELALRDVKRLSIGIQSFDDEILKSVGRGYFKGDELQEIVSSAKGYFDTLNIDLIAGFPSQSLEQFSKDISIFKDLEVDQATFYPLMPSPRRKTAVERRFAKIDLSREKQFYDIIVNEVLHDGYIPSTPWCFSSERERLIDEYIIEYDDYVGTGCGAVSYVDGIFFVNSFSVPNYNSLLENNRLPTVRWRRLSPREEAQYYLFTKLFGLKLDKQAFQARFNKNMSRTLFLELFLLKRVGILHEKDGIMFVPEKGMFHVSTIVKEFFTALNNLREFAMTSEI